MQAGTVLEGAGVAGVTKELDDVLTAESNRSLERIRSLMGKPQLRRRSVVRATTARLFFVVSISR